MNHPLESCDSTCTRCPAATHLARMGVRLTHYDHVIALAGNPNTGKSTLFNALTGLSQHTGNWPGKTVTRAEGGFVYEQRRYKLVDLPGTYSLLSASEDEQIARNFILFGQPDCTIVVADATALERNLNLALQVLEITDKMVFCVNLIDEARRHGIAVDADQLSCELGVPVILTAAPSGHGLAELLHAVAGVVSGEISTSPYHPPTPPQLKQAVDELLPLIEKVAPGLPAARWVAYRLLEGDYRIREALASGELAQLAASDGSTGKRGATDGVGLPQEALHA